MMRKVQLQFVTGQISKCPVYLAELEMLNGEIHGLYNFRQTNFKGFSETFYGRVTVSKD